MHLFYYPEKDLPNNLIHSIRLQLSLKAKNYPEKLRPLIPQLLRCFQTVIFLLAVPGYGWLRLRKGVYMCISLCVCVPGGVGWRGWSPKAIHVHLAAHLHYGDLSGVAHIWFLLEKKAKMGVVWNFCGKRGDGCFVLVCVCVCACLRGGLRSGLCLLEVFLCVWRDLNTVIYFTSPKQIMQDIATQAEDWCRRWI